MNARPNHPITKLGASLLLVLTGCTTTSTTARTQLDPAAATSSPAPAGLDRIAFHREGDDRDHPQLWTANVDGTDAKPVGAQDGWWPDWSPDRTLLLFDFLDDNGDQQVATIRPDGSRRTVLTEGTGYNEAADYAPDGRSIIYAHSDVRLDDPAFATSLWLMNHDGTNQRPLRLGDGGGDDTEAEYAPDGSKIAFLRYRHDTADRTAIFVALADGNQVRRVTPWLHKVEHPRWAPDGKTVIYNVEDQQHPKRKVNGIWTVAIDGEKPRQLLGSTSELHVFKPDYSPDGTRIVLGCVTRGLTSDDICLMNADGTGVERVVDDETWENHVVWD